MKAPLAIRFDKPVIEAKLKKLSKGTKLSSSDIARAAMNKGIEWIESNKIEMDKKSFSDDIKDYQ